MKALLLLALLGGCTTYFGGGDDGSDTRYLPDASPDPGPIDSGGTCPAEQPLDGEQCSFHQSGLSCYFEFDVCRCTGTTSSDNVWTCSFAYPDAGV